MKERRLRQKEAIGADTRLRVLLQIRTELQAKAEAAKDFDRAWSGRLEAVHVLIDYYGENPPPETATKERWSICKSRS